MSAIAAPVVTPGTSGTAFGAQTLNFVAGQTSPVTYAQAPVFQAPTVLPTTTSYLQAPTLQAPSVLQAPTALPATSSYVFTTPQVIAAPYAATSVQAAWDNHFDAFGKQDLEKILLDYDESSVLRLWTSDGGEKVEFVGLAAIRGAFTQLFKDLPDLSTLEAPVVDVDAAGNQVFLVWRCPGCGFENVTDTFIFGPDFKIKRQNVVIIKGAKKAEDKKDKTVKKKKGCCSL